LDVQVSERFYAAALELSAAGSLGRAHLDLKLGEAALWAGRSADAADSLKRAAEALMQGGDRRSAAVALARLARTRHDQAFAPREVEGLYREAVTLLQDDGPSDALIVALTEWGRELSMASGSDAALEAFERAIQVSQQLGVPPPPLALALRGAVRASLGDARFVEDYRRALDIAEAQGLGVERARVWGNYAFDLCLVEGPRRSLLEWERASDFCRSCGLTSLISYLHSNRVWVLVCAGDWDKAAQEAAQVERDFPQSSGNAEDLIFMRLLQHLPLVWRGADADARPGLARTLAEASRSEDIMNRCWGLSVAAIVDARRDADRAHERLEEALAEAPVKGDAGWFMVLPELARIALDCGDAGLAERLCRLVRGELPAVQNALGSVAAVCLEAKREYEPAAARFTDAASRWHGFEMPYEEAQALLGKGRCLLAIDSTREAAQALQQARGIFERLGAKPALAEVDERLEGATP
jgi:tetratricopeptide (TPR) repeat protein